MIFDLKCPISGTATATAAAAVFQIVSFIYWIDPALSSPTFKEVVRRPNDPYLLARFNPDTIFEPNDTSVMEFMPGYEPLEDWLIVADNTMENLSSCHYDFEIGLIPFDTLDRFADYHAMKMLPAIKLMDFYRRDLSYLFDPARAPKQQPYYPLSCRFDTIYFDPHYRYTGYIGSRQMSYDARWNTVHVGHAPVPFIRHIDTVYRDSRGSRSTHFKIYISNNWFYKFDMHTDTFHSQGYLTNLWPTFPSMVKHYGIDSVLVTPHNQSICRFMNNLFQCDDQVVFSKLEDVFENGQDISTPIRASFHVPISRYIRFAVALFDSEDRIWMYQYHPNEDRYQLLYKTHLCQFLLFGRLPCCDKRINSNLRTDSLEEEDGSGSSKGVLFEEDDGSGSSKGVLFEEDDGSGSSKGVSFEKDDGSGSAEGVSFEKDDGSGSFKHISFEEDDGSGSGSSKHISFERDDGSGSTKHISFEKDDESGSLVDIPFKMDDIVGSGSSKDVPFKEDDGSGSLVDIPFKMDDGSPKGVPFKKETRLGSPIDVPFKMDDIGSGSSEVILFQEENNHETTYTTIKNRPTILFEEELEKRVA